MKFKVLMVLIVLLFASTYSIAQEYPNLDDVDVRKDVDCLSFRIGNDTRVGNFYYIVDRTTNQCFAMIIHRGNGIVEINCEKIKTIPKIKKYIETGEYDKKDYKKMKAPNR